MADYYLWFKTLHLISLVAWFAGLFYLPRLFVYHTQVAPGSEMANMFVTMERRLQRYIMNPAMISTLLFGLLLISIPNLVDWKAGWWHLKLTLLVVLFGFHGLCARWRKAFARGENKRSERFFRRVNEVPTLCLVGIIIAVVIKPF